MKQRSNLLFVDFSGSGSDGNARETTSTPASSRPANTEGLSGMFNSPGMQSLMQQMMDNPQLMQNMMNAPYTQSMFQNISSNPELAEQIIVNNPLFAGI